MYLLCVYYVKHHYTQAVGEPPLFLGASVAFAIRDAIAYVRRQAGVSECFTLDSPVTCERIRMACPDHITKQVANQLDS